MLGGSPPRGEGGGGRGGGWVSNWSVHQTTARMSLSGTPSSKPPVQVNYYHWSHQWAGVTSCFLEPKQWECEEIPPYGGGTGYVRGRRLQDWARDGITELISLQRLNINVPILITYFNQGLKSSIFIRWRRVLFFAHPAAIVQEEVQHWCPTGRHLFPMNGAPSLLLSSQFSVRAVISLGPRIPQWSDFKMAAGAARCH